MRAASLHDPFGAGMKSLLERPELYRLFARLVGAERGRSIHVNEYVRPRAGDRILDIGCGPGDILDHLPDVAYVGFDMNPSYIQSAKERYGQRGEFICRRVSDEQVSRGQEASFDIVLATGVLHHLDDAEAGELFDIASRALRKGGRLVTFDGCFVDGQSSAARYLLLNDRGRFVRRPEGYVGLASRAFGSVEPHIRDDLLRIPYTHIILECLK
jgi:SAM-dependent methyltransferase